MPPNISELEQKIGRTFTRRDLLTQALTHSSHAREFESQQKTQSREPDNEQLEFMGDAVLGFVTSQELFLRFPHFSEGELSKLRAYLVSAQHLLRTAQELELGRYLRLGRGEEKSGGRNKEALLVDALEAVIAAVYLDAGLDAARSLILSRILDAELKQLEKDGGELPSRDHKSALLEAAQAAGRPQPVYVVLREEGPDHRKTFTVEARLQRRDDNQEVEISGQSEGATKKEAEQGAAREVLRQLRASVEAGNGNDEAKV
jgi:ribonuclease-3